MIFCHFWSLREIGHHLLILHGKGQPLHFPKFLLLFLHFSTDESKDLGKSKYSEFYFGLNYFFEEEQEDILVCKADIFKAKMKSYLH